MPKIRVKATAQNPWRKRAQALEKLQQDQIQSFPVEDRFNDNEVGDLSGGKLQHLFDLEEVPQGGKIRTVTTPGDLYDIYWERDGSLVIQKLHLKLQYGNKASYPNFEEAQKALESIGDFDLYAAKKHAKIVKVIDETKGDNPWNSLEKPGNGRS